ncbi:hypothetical protein WG78_11880 [Amantichitinum ursilacus]|uniref:Uncharacterized protein n=2 Tax=Amantichitinum ursilacus TaxID=857265 RepID=A0A0N0GN81_9NEIS|nr:hypothetical protein WG78_11880 [Amantichitinum ursilacus]
MQRICDLYLSELVGPDLLKDVRFVDSAFILGEKAVSGYLGLNAPRLKLIPLVVSLRKKRVSCYSVPIEYRDCASITEQYALSIAQHSVERQNCVKVGTNPLGAGAPPNVWSFSVAGFEDAGRVAGRMIMIDRVDGHVWGYEEYEEYMYDYNNLY